MSRTRTADTSVVVPALAEWHEHHERARAAIVGIDRLPGHVLVESYSVLTRLPQGLAASTEKAEKALRTTFPGAPLTLDAGQYRAFMERLASTGLRGGAVYDALVGWTAAVAGVDLCTRDVRASETYRNVGVRIDLVG